MAAFDQQTEGITATSIDELKEWISENKLPFEDKIYAALTAAGVSTPSDLLELTNEDIRDICVESKLTIMMKRKLLNAKQLYQTNYNISKQKDEKYQKNIPMDKRVLVIKVTEKEAKIKQDIKNFAQDKVQS